LGWVLWRNETHLPKDLVFELHYLGGTEQTYTLSFSRPAAHVIGQYFNFLTLGHQGYAAVMHNALQNARILSKALDHSGYFTCISDIHRKKGTFTSTVNDALERMKLTECDPSFYNPGLPVVAFRLSDKFRGEYPHVKQQSVSTLLRAKGYIVPNYTLPPNMEKTEILRIVVRETMSADLLQGLVGDILSIAETLMKADLVELAGFSAGTTERVEKAAGSLGEKKHGNAGTHTIRHRSGTMHSIC
jgi:glutamate decarboxylase